MSDQRDVATPKVTYDKPTGSYRLDFGSGAIHFYPGVDANGRHLPAADVARTYLARCIQVVAAEEKKAAT